MLTSFVDLCAQFPKALLSGLLIATTCGLFGVFVLLHRVVFISIALTECAACGIAAATLWHFHPFLGASIACLITVLLLALDWEKNALPRDAVLGTIFVGASALSVLLVAKSGFGLLEVKALLYGDLILASSSDLQLLCMVQLPILLLGGTFLRPVLYTFLDRDAAQLLGIPTRTVEFLFFLALGLIVAAACRIAGALLVFCYLVVPPAIGLLLSRRLAIVLIAATLSGALATVSGLTLSYHYDLPGNQCIVVTACALLVLLFAIRKIRFGAVSATRPHNS